MTNSETAALDWANSVTVRSPAAGRSGYCCSVAALYYF